MTFGAINKTARESVVLITLFAAAAGAIATLLTQILPQLQGSLNSVLTEMPFVRTLLSGLMGVDVGEGLTIQMMMGVLWAHPAMLAIVWGFELIFCTRFPVGEIDRGTVDLLLGWPLTRRAIYVAETVVWLISGVLIIGMALTGYLLSSLSLEADMRPALGRMVLVAMNFLLVYLAVGGATFLVSSFSDRRARAIGLVFGVLLASFLLNFLAQFWSVARTFDFLSISHYYQPGLVLRSGVIPMSHIVVLSATSLVCWFAGAWLTDRRSIMTT